MAPEDQDRFRGLMTEVVISAAGAPILVVTAVCLAAESGYSYFGGLPPTGSPPFWETVVFQWLPLLLLALAFGCLIWLITIPLRMGGLKRGG